MAGSDANDTAARNEQNMIDADFSVCNLMDEIDNDGWLRTTAPVGSGQLNKLHTVGGRGMELKDLRTRSRVDTGD